MAHTPGCLIQVCQQDKMRKHSDSECTQSNTTQKHIYNKRDEGHWRVVWLEIDLADVQAKAAHRMKCRSLTHAPLRNVLRISSCQILRLKVRHEVHWVQTSKLSFRENSQNLWWSNVEYRSQTTYIKYSPNKLAFLLLISVLFEMHLEEKGSCSWRMRK